MQLRSVSNTFSPRSAVSFTGGPAVVMRAAKGVAREASEDATNIVQFVTKDAAKIEGSSPYKFVVKMLDMLSLPIERRIKNPSEAAAVGLGRRLATRDFLRYRETYENNPCMTAVAALNRKIIGMMNNAASLDKETLKDTDLFTKAMATVARRLNPNRQV